MQGPTARLARNWMWLVSVLATATSFARSVAHAEIISYSNNFAGWQQAAGPYKTCTFTEFDPFTIVTDQYAELGVLFTNHWSDVVKFSEILFPLDGFGIDANGILELTFTETMYAAALHGPGGPRLKMYKDDVYLGEVQTALGSPSNLTAAVSTIGFNKVRFMPPALDGEVFADNIYFSTVPGPGGAAVVTLALAARRRSRRGQC